MSKNLIYVECIEMRPTISFKYTYSPDIGYDRIKTELL